MWENFFKHVDVLPENVCTAATSNLATRQYQFISICEGSHHSSFSMRGQVHILDGNAGDGESAALQAECRRYCLCCTIFFFLCSKPPAALTSLRHCRYEQCILSYGGIELFLAGIGHDGHIAFNEPGPQLLSARYLLSLSVTVSFTLRLIPHLSHSRKDTEPGNH